MLSVGINHFLVLSIILFVIGFVSLAFNRKSLINVLLGLELILIACNINFVAGSAFLNNVDGQIYTFFVLTIAAAESAIGLALIVCLYRRTQSIDLQDIKE